MGASNFLEIGTGKSVNDAFRTVAEQSAYEYGHDAYSGTIAAKPGAALVATLPARWTVRDFDAALADIDVSQYDEPLRAADKRRIERLRTALGSAKVDAIAHLWGDKWGDAVAVEVTGAEAKRLAPNKPHGHKVYAFLGLAPS